MKILQFETLRSCSILLVFILLIQSLINLVFGFPVIILLNKILGYSDISSKIMKTITFDSDAYNVINYDDYMTNYYVYPLYRDGIYFNFKVYSDKVIQTAITESDAESIISNGIVLDNPISEKTSSRWFIIFKDDIKFLYKTSDANPVLCKGYIRPLPKFIKDDFMEPGLQNFYMDGELTYNYSLQLFTVMLILLSLIQVLLLIELIRIIMRKSNFVIYGSIILREQEHYNYVSNINKNLLKLLPLLSMKRYKIGNYEIIRNLWGSKIMKKI